MTTSEDRKDLELRRLTAQYLRNLFLTLNETISSHSIDDELDFRSKLIVHIDDELTKSSVSPKHDLILLGCLLRQTILKRVKKMTEQGFDLSEDRGLEDLILATFEAFLTKYYSGKYKIVFQGADSATDRIFNTRLNGRVVDKDDLQLMVNYSITLGEKILSNFHRSQL